MWKCISQSNHQRFFRDKSNANLLRRNFFPAIPSHWNCGRQYKNVIVAFARIPANVLDVKSRMKQSLRRSTRRLSLQVSISRRSVHRGIHENLKLSERYEVHFHLCGHVNWQTCRFGASEQHHEHVEKSSVEKTKV